MRFEASLHGVDLEKKAREQGIDTDSTQKRKGEKIDIRKGDAEYYSRPEVQANMTDEEKEEVTHMMMGQMKAMFGTGNRGSPKGLVKQL